MKKLTFLAVLLLAGCTLNRYRADYEYGLKSVAVNSRESAIDQSQGTQNTFEDDTIKVTFDLESTYIGFVLQNKSSNTLKVLWDESAFISNSGNTMRVLHNGIRYIEKDKPIPPSLVAAGGKIDDLVAPTDLMTFSSSGGWHSGGIFPEGYGEYSRYVGEDGRDQMKAFVDYSRGRDLFGMILTLEEPDGKKEYLFSFCVCKAEMIDTQPVKK